MAIGDWMKSEAWLANIGHFMAGALALLIALRFTHGVDPLYYVESAFVLLVLTKEYLVDLIWESGETVGSSTVDALGYVLGNLAAWALVLATGGVSGHG